jgi:DNA invertase Pin-like site-specific DNA recombinase
MNSLTSPEVAEIVAKVGRPRSTNNGKIALDVERIKAMRKAGFSWLQIADYLDVGVSTVRRRLAESVIRPLRDVGRGALDGLGPWFSRH